MKHNKIIIAVNFIFIMTLFSCEKFLDIKTESRQVFAETAADCQLILDNYSLMNTGYPSDGESSSGDSYLNDAAYLSVFVSAEDRSIYTWNSNAVRDLADLQWKPCYYIIYNANFILETIDRKLKGVTDQNVIDGLRGSALFYRAYCLWQLAQLYAKPYSSITSSQDLGVPIRLSSDINEISNRGNVQQTYDRILQDLKEASNLLPSASTIASRPSKVACYAMLARVYLSMEDYNNAQINASAALSIKNDLLDYNSLNKTSSTPFTPRFNKEIIFQSVTRQSQMLAAGVGSFAKIDPMLVSSYEANDLRRIIFFKTISGTPASYLFSGNYEPTINGTLFNGLAVDELYLIRAECYARSGNVTSALSDLNTLLRTRWLSGSYIELSTTITADETLIKVLTERRKELLMRGQRWTDLRRLNKDTRFAITLTRSVQGRNYTLPPNDLRYTLLIPNEVIRNASLPQNPR